MERVPPAFSTRDVERISEASNALLRAHRRKIDRIFAGFLIYEWILGIVIALWLARRDSLGIAATIRAHLWVAILIGAILSGVPVSMAWRWRGHAVTRHTIAACQLLFSGLLIYLTDDRIGMHFHICASFIFLLFYRDFWVLITATAAVAMDQMFRGWPLLIAAEFAPHSRWRTVEHAGWLGLAAVFVLESLYESHRRVKLQAMRELQLESALIAAEDRSSADLRAKSELLASAGQSIRAPVESVLGMSALLLDTVLTPTQERVVRAIQESGERLRSSINDVVDFSHLETGQVNTDPVPFDLQLVISQAVDWLDPQIRKKGLKLWVKYPPRCPRRFVGDRGRIRQILLNLLTHALQCTEYGGITLSVEAVGTFGNETTLRITVTDTGSGMAVEQVEEVFQPGGNAGLTLALSRRLADLMGGAMGASSKPGVGSQFWFTMVLKRDTQVRGSELAGLRIVVVDPVPANRQILAEVLSQWGCRAECAASTAAIERLSDAVRSGDPFRMLLTGHRMAEADAELLGHTVKEDSLVQSTVLVMAAAYPTPAGCRRALAAGFTEYIENPLSMAAIHEGLVQAWREAVASSVMTKDSGLRVLIVDANWQEQRRAWEILEDMGCVVDAASNGDDAIEHFEQSQYDLVLISCHLPGKDAYETVMQMRSRERVHVPIVGIIDPHADSRMACIAAGMDDCLHLPVQPQTLKALLLKYRASTWNEPRLSGTIEPVRR